MSLRLTLDAGSKVGVVVVAAVLVFLVGGVAYAVLRAMFGHVSF